MNKILGIFGLLVFVCLFTTVLSDSFVSAYNMYNITRWSALFGILSIGVAFVIITGGIDLSIGSVVGLIGSLLPLFLISYEWSVPAALVVVMTISLGIGLLHGLLITKLELQPFVVTLCGLLFYRGFARWYTQDKTQGFGQAHDDGLRLLAIGKPCSVSTLLLVLGGVAAVFFLIRCGWLWYRRDSARLRPSLLALAFAIVLAVIGSSRFWGGFEVLSATPLMSLGGFQLSSLRVNVPEQNAARPTEIMFWTGLVIFIPAALWFVVMGMQDYLRRTVIPLFCVVVASVVFSLVAWRIAPMFQEVSRGEAYRVGSVEMSGGMLRSLIMMLVFVTTGLFMGSIAWLASTVSSISDRAKGILPVVLFGGVLWLMGMTELPRTMVPMPMLIMLVTAVVAGVFLNQTIFGRYLLALGRNEEAARYSGINTDRMTIMAYVICSGMAGLGAILFAADINSVQPSGHGNFYELYAIAAAVLGGCSLRGGEGSILGVIIGAAVMRVLYNAINILGIATQLEFAIIGVVILTGAVVDVLVKRIVARRRAKLQAAQLDLPAAA